MKQSKKHSNSHPTKGIFFGLLLILAGGLFLAFNLGWLDSSLREIVFSWQMIFIVLAVITLFHKRYLATLCWLGLGTFFLLPKIAKVYPNTLPWVDSDFAANYWPVLVIVFGIGVVLCIIFRKKVSLEVLIDLDTNDDANKITGTDGTYNRKIVFGGSEDVFLEPVFRGGKIEVTFGGVELDLRRTSLPEGDTHLILEVIFGGVELRVPEDWKVISKIDAIFGGVEEKKQSKMIEVDSSRRLLITGNVIFGGCEIR